MYRFLTIITLSIVAMSSSLHAMEKLTTAQEYYYLADHLSNIIPTPTQLKQNGDRISSNRILKPTDNQLKLVRSLKHKELICQKNSLLNNILKNKDFRKNLKFSPSNPQESKQNAIMEQSLAAACQQQIHQLEHINDEEVALLLTIECAQHAEKKQYEKIEQLQASIEHAAGIEKTKKVLFAHQPQQHQRLLPALVLPPRNQHN